MQGNWQVSPEILEKYKVRALERFEFFNNEKEDTQKIKLYPGVIGFAYELGNSAELYIPKQQKNKKFFLNKTSKEDIYGFEQLPKKVEHLIICAGKKDCLILNANGFHAVTFRSENHTITPLQIEILQKKATQLCICYDNDAPGQAAMKRVIKDYEVVPIALPKFAGDIADFFLSYTRDDFRKILLESLNIPLKKETIRESTTIYHMVKEFLEKYYEFRFNTISIDIEYRKRGSFDWKSVNEHDLYIKIRESSLKISMNDLIAILKSDFVPIYNPIEEYFKGLPKWDKKTDYIANLASYVQAIDKDQFVLSF